MFDLPIRGLLGRRLAGTSLVFIVACGANASGDPSESTRSSDTSQVDGGIQGEVPCTLNDAGTTSGNGCFLNTASDDDIYVVECEKYNAGTVPYSLTCGGAAAPAECVALQEYPGQYPFGVYCCPSIPSGTVDSSTGLCTSDTGTGSGSSGGTTDCEKSICQVQAKRETSCGSCTQSICDLHPHCCTSSWDKACVDDVATVCGETCE